jgi:ribosomal protein S18 acetylase RimI-like enzyme
MNMITIQPAQLGQGAVCAAILADLPSWFGRPEANRHYIEFVETHLTFVAYEMDKPIGFLTIQQHFPESAEIYVMGVLAVHHRQGIGRKLVSAAENSIYDNGTQFLQVKTLGAAHPDDGYRQTRLFYLGVGFTPLEEFEDLWGANTPALLLVKHLPCTSRNIS